MPGNQFWNFRNLTGDTAELVIYGAIAQEKTWFEDDVWPGRFAGELKELGNVKRITVRINSGGGDVFAAQAIGNMLEQHSAFVTAVIDGLCGSAATIIACHCDKVVAAEDSTYMIHPVQMGLCGYMDAEELNRYVNALTTIRENILNLYARKTGRDFEEVAAWMDATSWWTGPKAKENGFVDELAQAAGPVTENRNGALFINSVDMGLAFGEAPDFVRNRGQREANKTPAGEPGRNEEETMEIKTVNDLRQAYPELVKQVEQEAANNAAAAERGRIRDIQNMILPGSEDLASWAMFEQPMQPTDFAAEMVKNMKAQGAAYLAGARQDARDSGAGSVESAEPRDKDNGAEFLNAIRSAQQ